MIWIIVLSALAVCAVFFLCLLISGSRGDDRKEEIFTNRLVDRTDTDVASSPSSSMPEKEPRALAQHQEITLPPW
jgi:hypothetical protein